MTADELSRRAKITGYLDLMDISVRCIGAVFTLNGTALWNALVDAETVRIRIGRQPAPALLTKNRPWEWGDE